MTRALFVLLAACHSPAAPIAPAPPPPSGPPVVELDHTMYTFAPTMITIRRGDQVLAKTDTSTGDKPLAWIAAGTIDAPDGSGRWVIGLANDGALYHVTIEAGLESITDRLGLTGLWITAFASTGPTFAASAAGGKLAITVDGTHMQLFDNTFASALAVGPHRVAFVTGTRTVESWDLDRGSRRSFTIDAPLALAFAESELVVRANSGRFVERAGRLVASSEALAPARSPWDAGVKPIFDRVCAKCHLPGGSADVDLASQATWHAHATALLDRLTDRSMPPPGTLLEEADRTRLVSYLRSAR